MTEALARRAPLRTIVDLEHWGHRPRPIRQSQTASTSRDIFTVTVEFDDDNVTSPATNLWQAVIPRLEELRALPDGWDSYGGSQLQWEAVERLVALLIKLGASIQSTPLISLTPDGGLSCRWRTRDALLELRVDPQDEPEVYFRDKAEQTEWEGPVTRCPINRWVWQASSTL